MQRRLSAAVTRYPHTVEPLRAITECEHCGARAHNVCSVIAILDLDRLASIAVTVNVESGRNFIREGDPADHFFNVTSGTAKLFKLLPDGRRQITGFAGIGHFLGLAVSATYSFSAEAINSVRFCRYSRLNLKEMLRAFPAMEARLLEVASNELVAAQEQMLLLGRKTARERVATFLVGRAQESPRGIGRSATPAEVVDLPMTRSDIADYLGLSIETVSRTLSLLRSDEIIEIPAASRITICNYAKLEALASGLRLVGPLH